MSQLWPGFGPLDIAMVATLRRGLSLFFLLLVSILPIIYGWDYARDIAGMAFYLLTIPVGIYSAIAE